jgi:hypothetical protein
MIIFSFFFFLNEFALSVPTQILKKKNDFKVNEALSYCVNSIIYDKHEIPN